VNRTGTLAAAARDAAGAVADLEREAGRIDPYIPLAAYAAPLQDADRAAVSASNGLYAAAAMAGDALSPYPGLPEPDVAGGVRGQLAIATMRAGRAADLIGAAADAVRRDLRGADIAADVSVSPLSRRAAIAAECLGRLQGALEQAARSDDAVAMLAALDQASGQQAVIIAGLGRICDRYCYGVTEAYERLPGAAPRKAARATGPLHRASATLQKAAAITSRAHSTLAGEHARARTAAVQAGR
jgi:hypothetical protein